jgi:hypothetical protein
MNAHQTFNRIVAANGGVTQFALDYADRASLAMDPELRERVDAVFDGFPGVEAGDFLRLYCELHMLKYRREFEFRA